MKIELEKDVKQRMDEIARDCNLPVERACEIVLSQFASLEGGRIYTGTWREGQGLIFVVQWPFLTGLVKIRGEDLPRTTEVR